MDLHKRFLCVCGLLLTFAVSVGAQTIIDLNKGGGVRAKQRDEYNTKTIRSRALAQDSLLFRDNVTQGFNALAIDSLAKADRLFRDAIKQMPHHDAVPLLRQQLGRIAEVQQNYREAIRQFSEALRLNSSLKESRLHRAYSYLEVDNVKAARSDCDALLEDNPNDTTVLFLSSTIHVRQRLYSDARRDLQHFLDINQDNVNGWTSLGIVNQKDKRLQEALFDFNRALTIEPNNADALSARADLEQQMGYNDLAMVDLDKAIAQSPSRSELYLQRAVLLIAMKNKSAARSDLDRAVGLGVYRSSILDLYKKVE